MGSPDTLDNKNGLWWLESDHIGDSTKNTRIKEVNETDVCDLSECRAFSKTHLRP